MMKKITFLTFALLTLVFSTAAQTPAPTPTPEIPVRREPIDVSKMTEKDVTDFESALKVQPGDSQKRKALIEYYMRDEDKNPESRKSLRRHRVLLIQTSPGERYYRELGYWNGIADRNDPHFVELKNEYLRQVARHKDDREVRLNAVSFLEGIDPEAAENILKERLASAPDDFLFFEELIELYGEWAAALKKLFDEGDKTITEADIDRVNAKLIAQGELKLAALAKAEAPPNSDERLRLLLKSGNAALEMNDAKKARVFAEAILKDFINPTPEAGDNEAIFYGNTLMGRVFLREGDVNKAKEHLAKSLVLYIGDDWEISEPELDLAGELLMRGEKQAVLDYLQKSESLMTNQNVRKIYRNWQRRIKRNLMPFEPAEF